jgi:hypothetical protein
VDNDKRALGCLHAACSTRTLHTRSALALTYISFSALANFRRLISCVRWQISLKFHEIEIISDRVRCDQRYG